MCMMYVYEYVISVASFHLPQSHNLYIYPSSPLLQYRGLRLLTVQQNNIKNAMAALNKAEARLNFVKGRSVDSVVDRV